MDSLFYDNGIVVHKSYVLNLYKAKLSDSSTRYRMKGLFTRSVQNKIIKDVHILQRGGNLDHRLVDPNPQVSVNEEIKSLTNKQKSL